MKQVLKISLITLAAVVCQSCREVMLHEKIFDFKSHEWHATDKVWIPFDIKDSGRYQPYIIVRHSQQFPYNKMIINMVVKDSGNITRDSMQVALPLQDKTGHWRGNNIDDLYDEYTDLDQMLTLSKGRYQFVLSQAMQEKLLPHVFNIGVGLKRLQ